MHSAQVSPHLSFRYLSGCQNKSFQAKICFVYRGMKRYSVPSRPFDEQKTHMSRRPFGSVCDLAGSEL